MSVGISTAEEPRWVARIRKFKEFQANAQPEFRNVTKYVGVLCALPNFENNN
ncbi:hypothetical protein BDEG_25427 [Batrachochytrium dendrobatidis JEL423]|uniref:Uncharacterized protein n=1 Tax=Batrachochytrium dendrobatidis (strain JEL423) TaxID=403673 RepID=A0A177WP50_BATDL|nr:hypothetical protein BDEG_25427 [Batrachochytrium dendrobatidis JEL423]